MEALYWSGKTDLKERVSENKQIKIMGSTVKCFPYIFTCIQIVLVLQYVFI